ncbi:MAG: TetR/AcrR family transcriptional regulator [Clostridia bacterium]|jgi:AcrR family transcriptional regulator|nr:TetR/AcrR family transcriptional regulator [Clostridiaceae bacterium]
MLKGCPCRREAIVLAAIDVINENGLQGLSTKKIAAKQNISESLLYKYFSGIDDILAGVADYICRSDTDVMSNIINIDASFKEKIRLYIEAFVGMYDSYPPLAGVFLQTEGFLCNPHTSPIVLDMSNKRMQFVEHLIQEGKMSGEIGGDFSVEELLNILNGILLGCMLRWKLSGYRFSLKDSVVTAVMKVLDKC